MIGFWLRWSFLPWCPEGWQSRYKAAEKRDDRFDPEWYFKSILCKIFIFKKVKLPYLLTSSNYKSQLCSEQNLFCKLFSSKNSFSSSDSSPWNLQLDFPVLSFCCLLWAIHHDFIVRIIFISFSHCFSRSVPLLMGLLFLTSQHGKFSRESPGGISPGKTQFLFDRELTIWMKLHRMIQEWARSITRWQGHFDYPLLSSPPPKQIHPQSLKFLGLVWLGVVGKIPFLWSFVSYVGSAYFFVWLFLSVMGRMSGISFTSTHPDQSFYFPQYHFIISLPTLRSPIKLSLPMFLCPSLYYFLPFLSSATPPWLITHADFVRVPLLPVSESYTIGTNTVCSVPAVGSWAKLKPLSFVILHFLATFQRKTCSTASEEPLCLILSENIALFSWNTASRAWCLVPLRGNGWQQIYAWRETVAEGIYLII